MLLGKQVASLASYSCVHNLLLSDASVSEACGPTAGWLWHRHLEFLFISVVLIYENLIPDLCPKRGKNKNNLS